MMAGLNDGLSVDHDYRRLTTDFGIELVHDVAASIDPVRKTVTLMSGAALPYDRLVLSPGIDFAYGEIEGYTIDTSRALPHCWRSDQPIEMLKARIDTMPEGGVFAITVPALPYRCPPGPYERASMVAHVLTRQNPRAKILVIDDKDTFPKQAVFLDGWARHYPGMIEWLPRSQHGGVKAVSVSAKEIVCEFTRLKADVLNVVPPQTAGWIAKITGLTDTNGWCPVRADGMVSLSDPSVHVLGDSSRAPAMPKSAESAANQARLAARHIVKNLAGIDVLDHRIANTCWSLIAKDDGVKVGATYFPDGEQFIETSTSISIVGEHHTLRRMTYVESLGWYRGLTSELFGGA